MGAGEHRNVHGYGGGVGLVQPHAKVTFTAQQQQDKHACAKIKHNMLFSDNRRPLGLGTEFRSEKIPRNRLGMVPIISRKKAFIPRHS
jgi:hypothetical protein